MLKYLTYGTLLFVCSLFISNKSDAATNPANAMSTCVAAIEAVSSFGTDRSGQVPIITVLIPHGLGSCPTDSTNRAAVLKKYVTQFPTGAKVVITWDGSVYKY